ncbi:hypothetical protein ACQUQU_03325 [Thalassolituus sp. LLYu03]|uniref:hypothetical protein n=1 Tax=Thalassolituus sp. LLYu03 TaxID=3421656 RepID=UPI003D279AF5
MAALLAVLVAAPAVCSANSLSAQWQQDYRLYKEFSESGHELDRESGWLPALALSGEGDLSDAVSVSAGLRVSDGRLNYQGQTQNGSALNTQAGAVYQEQQLGLGYTTAGYGVWSGGLYRQRWSRDIRPTTASAQLKEFYDWYGPWLAATAHWQKESWQGSVRLEGRYRFAGQLTLDLQEQGLGKPDITLQGGGSLRLLNHAQFALSRYWSLSLSAGLEGARYPRSETVDVRSGSRIIHLAEPESLEWRLQLGAGADFVW